MKRDGIRTTISALSLVYALQLTHVVWIVVLKQTTRSIIHGPEIHPAMVLLPNREAPKDRETAAQQYPNQCCSPLSCHRQSLFPAEIMQRLSIKLPRGLLGSVPDSGGEWLDRMNWSFIVDIHLITKPSGGGTRRTSRRGCRDRWKRSPYRPKFLGRIAEDGWRWKAASARSRGRTGRRR